MSLGELVPGACQLAVVATEDAIADQWTQGFIDAAVVFDGEVADAAPGIDTIRCDDGAGRADVDAARAGAAMRAGRRVHRQRQVGDRKSTRLNSSHYCAPRMPSSACKKTKRTQM